jgi:hypothetical protein
MFASLKDQNVTHLIQSPRILQLKATRPIISLHVSLSAIYVIEVIFLAKQANKIDLDKGPFNQPIVYTRVCQ